MRKRAGVLISGNGSTLQALLDSQEAFDVRVVISTGEQAYGCLRARRSAVPVLILPFELRRKENKLKAEEWMIETLRYHRIEVLFLAGYMKILTADFIKKYGNPIINIHPSLLPQYKGLNSFQKALEAGDTEAGVTIHHAAAEVDSGEFILQRRFCIPPHRESRVSHLWLHIQEQRLFREGARKVMWPSQRT